jgi:hypothetical protein
LPAKKPGKYGVIVRVKHIVSIPFTVNRESRGPLPEKWVNERFDFFRRYTLKSLLNQDFKTFDIWVLCGSWCSQYTNSLPWNGKIKVVDDLGKCLLANTSVDYIAITRIDSDDLMHRQAMEEVRRETRAAIRSGIEKKGFLVFKDNLCWNMVEGNNFVSKHIRKHPPFYTEIFPELIYKNWDRYMVMTNHPHGKAHLDADYYKELSKNKICVIKHYSNDSNIKNNREPVVMSNERWEENLKKGKVISKDKKVMREYLKDFGVECEK